MLIQIHFTETNQLKSYLKVNSVNGFAVQGTFVEVHCLISQTLFVIHVMRFPDWKGHWRWLEIRWNLRTQFLDLMYKENITWGLILPSFSYFVNFVDKRVIVAKCFLSTVFRCTVSDVILRILIVFQDCHILYNTKFLLIFFLWASKLPSFKNLIEFSSKRAFLLELCVSVCKRKERFWEKGKLI